MRRVKTTGLFLFIIILSNYVFLFPEAPGFTISGEITFKKQHAITVEIINKNEYDKNLPSNYSIIIPINDELAKEKLVSFSVSGVPEGEYIVKVYQDLNENGKFDFAFAGGDPLGTYKKPGFTLGRPSFKSLSFMLTKDLSGIKITL